MAGFRWTHYELRSVGEVVVRVYFFAAFYEANGSSARNRCTIRPCRTLSPPVVIQYNVGQRA